MFDFEDVNHYKSRNSGLYYLLSTGQEVVAVLCPLSTTTIHRGLVIS